MTQHRDEVYLRHMLEHAREAISIQGSLPKNEVTQSRILQLALLHLVEIVGEAAGRISPATRAQLANFPWSGMIGMRNRIIHGYDTVSIPVVWDTIAHDLPELVLMLESHLAKVESEREAANPDRDTE